MKFCIFSKVVFVLIVTTLSDGISVEKDLSMTVNEKKALDKFRERTKPLLKHDHMKTDIYLVRWLRARNFNLDAAEVMLKENLRWRRENKIDRILNESFNDIARDYHATIDTYDKEGRPVGVIDINEWDIRRAVLQGRGKRILRFMDYLMENITTQVFERQGKGMNVTQWKVLANCDGFNLITHGCAQCIPLWIQFVNNLENNYPGWLDELVAIDSPRAVNVIVEILKPFLSVNTRQALKIFSPNSAKWMPYLDERIDKSERRAAYGGTKPPAQF